MNSIQREISTQRNSRGYTQAMANNVVPLFFLEGGLSSRSIPKLTQGEISFVKKYDPAENQELADPVPEDPLSVIHHLPSGQNPSK